jgi:hypothetical protein
MTRIAQNIRGNIDLYQPELDTVHDIVAVASCSRVSEAADRGQPLPGRSRSKCQDVNTLAGDEDPGLEWPACLETDLTSRSATRCRTNQSEPGLAGGSQGVSASGDCQTGVDCQDPSPKAIPSPPARPIRLWASRFAACSAVRSSAESKRPLKKLMLGIPPSSIGSSSPLLIVL